MSKLIVILSDSEESYKSDRFARYLIAYRRFFAVAQNDNSINSQPHNAQPPGTDRNNDAIVF
jgi:hypothetical protein